jgi:nucleoside-diphosphate-sugar epimerase
MNVLVTGGTGYLGRAIVAALLRHGHRPTAFARRALAATDLAVPRIAGDVRDRDTLLTAARGMDGVIHTAALVSVWQKDRADFDRINVGGLETVVDVCAAHGIPRLVVTSSFLALPPAGRRRPLEANDYQRSKVRAREVVRAAVSRGVPVVSVTPGVVYGPGIESEGNLVGKMIRDHLAGQLPGLIGAGRTWSFSYVEDVADAHVRALERGDPGDDYVAGGENAAQLRAFEIVRDLTGARLPRRIPTVLAHLAGLAADLRARRGVPPPLTRGTVRILRHDWPLDSLRSVQKLSYRMTPLATGIRALLGGHS